MPLYNNTGVSQKVSQFFIHIYTYVIHTKICVFTNQLVLKIMTVGISDLNLYFTCDMQMCTVAYFFSAAKPEEEEEDISGHSATPPGSPASSQAATHEGSPASSQAATPPGSPASSQDTTPEGSPTATWDDVITRPALAMRQFRQPVNLDEKLYQPSTVPRRFKSIGMNDGILKRCFF